MLNALMVVKTALIGPATTHATMRLTFQKLRKLIFIFSYQIKINLLHQLIKRRLINCDFKCFENNVDRFNECNAGCNIDFVCLNDCSLELAEKI